MNFAFFLSRTKYRYARKACNSMLLRIIVKISSLKAVILFIVL